jgi:RNA recognition motif-containing protein
VVEFENPELAQMAIKDLNESQLMGRTMYLREDREQELKSRNSSQPSSSNSKQLFVGNLAYSVSWQDLKDMFREAGILFYSKNIRTGRSRRYNGDS